MAASEFSPEQFAAIYPVGIENHYWNRARNLVVAKILNQIKAGPILDVGAGRGVVTVFLKNQGFSVVGVEPASIPLDADLQKLILTDHSIADLPAELKNQTETVLLLDVIEHLPEPAVLLSEIKNNLPNCHQILITVPARPELWSNYDEFNGHYLRYCRADLSRLMVQNDWSPVLVSYYFHLLYWPAYVLAKLGRKRGVKIEAPRGFGLWAHRLLASLFYWDYLIWPKALLGSSVVAVFRR